MLESFKKQFSSTAVGAIVMVILSATGNYFQHKERMLEIQLRHEAEMESKRKSDVILEQSKVMEHFREEFEQ